MGVVAGVSVIVGVGVIVVVGGVGSEHGSSMIVAPPAIRLESTLEASSGVNVVVTGAKVVG